jgi:hypothetical protein
VVQCGYLVIAWKESATEYRFVVDGSRAKDMKAGTFLFNMSTADSHASITSRQINDCYGLQTRNEKNGTCNGMYLQVSTSMQAVAGSYTLSDLNWPEFAAVIGSVAAAVISVASVVLTIVRHRREAREDQTINLLPDLSQPECKTPDLNPSELQESITPVRQRALSPRAVVSKQ